MKKLLTILLLLTAFAMQGQKVIPAPKLKGVQTGSKTDSVLVYGNDRLIKQIARTMFLSTLDASWLTTGTIDDLRLSSNVALLTGVQTFSGRKTFSDVTDFDNRIDANAGINLTGNLTGVNSTLTVRGLQTQIGTTDWLLYQNSNADEMYMRDVTNANMVTTWSPTQFRANQNFSVALNSVFDGTATFGGLGTFNNGLDVTGQTTLDDVVFSGSMFFSPPTDADTNFFFNDDTGSKYLFQHDVSANRFRFFDYATNATVWEHDQDDDIFRIYKNLNLINNNITTGSLTVSNTSTFGGALVLNSNQIARDNRNNQFLAQDASSVLTNRTLTFGNGTYSNYDFINGKINALGGLDVSNGLDLQSDNTADFELMRFHLDGGRDWTFNQTNTGAATGLELKSISNKTFTLKASDFQLRSAADNALAMLVNNTTKETTLYGDLKLSTKIIGTGTTWTNYEIANGDFDHVFNTRTDTGANLERLRITGGAVTGSVDVKNADFNVDGTATIYASDGVTERFKFDASNAVMYGPTNNDFKFQTKANGNTEGFEFLNHTGSRIFHLDRLGNTTFTNNLDATGQTVTAGSLISTNVNPSLFVQDSDSDGTTNEFTSLLRFRSSNETTRGRIGYDKTTDNDIYYDNTIGIHRFNQDIDATGQTVTANDININNNLNVGNEITAGTVNKTLVDGNSVEFVSGPSNTNGYLIRANVSDSVNGGLLIEDKNLNDLVKILGYGQSTLLEVFGNTKINGDINASNQTITAGSFTGNGANITNVNATSLNGQTADNLLDRFLGNSTQNIDTYNQNENWSVRLATATTLGDKPEDYVNVTNFAGDVHRGTQLASGYGTTGRFFLRRKSDAVAAENGIGWQPWKQISTLEDAQTFTGFKKFDAGLNIPDDANLNIGTGNDLRLWHTSSNSYIDNYTGVLNFRNRSHGDALSLNIEDGLGNNKLGVLVSGSDGHVRLYQNSSEKLRTVSTGVDITGELKADFIRNANNTNGLEDLNAASNIGGGALNYRWFADTATGSPFVGSNDANGVLTFGTLNVDAYANQLSFNNESVLKIRARDNGVWQNWKTFANLEDAQTFTGNKTFTGITTFQNQVQVGTNATNGEIEFFGGDGGVPQARLFWDSAAARLKFQDFDDSSPVVFTTGAEIEGQFFADLTFKDVDEDVTGKISFDGNTEEFTIDVDVNVSNNAIRANNVDTNTLRLTNAYTFSTLPSSPITGTIAYITDAGTVTYRGDAAGGGSNFALVVWNGTKWIYH